MTILDDLFPSTAPHTDEDVERYDGLYMTINEYDGRDIAWYLDADGKEQARFIDSGKQLSDAEMLVLHGEC